MITTHAFHYLSSGTSESVAWRQEQWSVRAGLIPIDQVAEQGPAIERAAKSIRAHDELEFAPWWRAETDFYFGDTASVGGVIAWPWLHHWTHRLDDEHVVIDPGSDFVRYHALDVRPLSRGKHGREYVHPLDQTVIMRTWVKRVAYFNPMPFAEVQRDYLRDYLVARRAVLLVAVVADRFANAPTVAELELPVLEQHQLDENAWITTTIHENSPHNPKLAMGRSSLYWNIVVAGYDKPKPSRNPWALYEEFGSKDNESLPAFIVGAEGARLRAGDRKCPAYLYFSLRVLERYLRTPGHGASFHMRTWGGISTPHGSVDAGVNSRGLLNAYMPDIAKLPVGEQQHWALHSVPPDGEICDAMFQTRMQQLPPNLPGVIDLISSGVSDLHDAVSQKFQTKLFSASSTELSEGRGALSIGPLGSEMKEVAELNVPLYAWIIQPMQISALRSILSKRSVAFDHKTRQIVLLRSILVEVVGMTAEDASELTGPLTAINELRAKAAHAAAADFDAVLPMLRLAELPSNPRELWDSIIDATADSLRKIALAIQTI
jgi:hypothetical protein